MWTSVSGFAVAGAEAVQHLLDRLGVGARLVGREARERTEEARRLADVGGLETQVVIEVGAIAVAPLALAIGQPADGEEVGRLEQPNALVEGEPFLRVHLLGDVGEPRGAKARVHATCALLPTTFPFHSFTLHFS